MEQKVISQLDDDGIFVGPVIADESPLEPGVWIIPARAVDAPPPKVPVGKLARWNGEKFIFETLPKPEVVPEHIPTRDEIFALYSGHIQRRLDEFARTRNYDGILSAATYATSSVAKFKTEGQYAVEARDMTWGKAYEIFAAVGDGSVPTIDEIMAQLPELKWPG